MAMGVSYEQFWELTPRSLNVIVEGYKLRRKVVDEQNWLLGGYVFQAVSVALGNSFRKKNQKAKSYFEQLDKPFLNNIGDNVEMSEEEKQRKLSALMASLHVMKNNFELTHGK